MVSHEFKYLFMYLHRQRIERKKFTFLWNDVNFLLFPHICVLVCMCSFQFTWSSTTTICIHTSYSVCLLKWKKMKAEKRREMLKDLGGIWNKEKQKMFQRFFTTQTKCSYMARNKCVKWQSFCVRFRAAHPRPSHDFGGAFFYIHLDLAILFKKPPWIILVCTVSRSMP